MHSWSHLLLLAHAFLREPVRAAYWGGVQQPLLLLIHLQRQKNQDKKNKVVLLFTHKTNHSRFDQVTHPRELIPKQAPGNPLWSSSRAVRREGVIQALLLLPRLPPFKSHPPCYPSPSGSLTNQTNPSMLPVTITTRNDFH